MKYYAYHNQRGFIPVDGKRVRLKEYPKLHLFVHVSLFVSSCHTISDAVCGCSIAGGETKREAMKMLKEILRLQGIQNYKRSVKKAISETGISPIGKKIMARGEI